MNDRKQASLWNMKRQSPSTILTGMSQCSKYICEACVRDTIRFSLLKLSIPEKWLFRREKGQSQETGATLQFFWIHKRLTPYRLFYNIHSCLHPYTIIFGPCIRCGHRPGRGRHTIILDGILYFITKLATCFRSRTDDLSDLTTRHCPWQLSVAPILAIKMIYRPAYRGLESHHG